MYIELLGFLAGFMTTASFFPQSLKVLRTKDTKAISLPMYAMFTFGVACWLAYGLLIGSLPIILANSITIVPAGIILYCKLRNKD